MTYSVGNSEVANYANTSSGKVTNVVADDGLGGSGVVTDVTDRVALSFVVATNIQFLTIDVTSLAGYVAGITDVTITVNPDVYVYGYYPTQTYPSSDTPSDVNSTDASMQVIGGATGDTIKLVNNGNIVGAGGDGGGAWLLSGGSYYLKEANKGNAALSFITPGITLAIENNGYIAGGGGGGGYGSGNNFNCFFITEYAQGGGGAGGGISGVPAYSNTRAIPPAVGRDGATQDSYACCYGVVLNGGGGGGFKLAPPDNIGGSNSASNPITTGFGGGTGGGGAVVAQSINAWDNYGGDGNNAAPTPTLFSNTNQGGGGGGWGAAGANGYADFGIAQFGAAGGNSIVTNGNAYTLTGSGALYGTVNTATTSVVYTIPTTVETGAFIDIATIPGYATGTNVLLMIPASVKLASNDNSTPGLSITKSGTGNDPSSVRIVVNGAILGAGGYGGSETITAPNISVNGGDALRLPLNSFGPGVPYIIDNINGYIAAGGGGGGRGQNNAVLGSATKITYGGGGAGLNGSSGVVGNAAYNAGVTSGVVSGTNGTNVVVGPVTYSSGGSGGTILPGTSTPNTGTFTNASFPGLGGTAGGSGAFFLTGTITNPSNAGGGYRNSGGAVNIVSGCSGGGGGGWGANGGIGRRANIQVSIGGGAGNAVRIQNTSAKVYVANLINLAGAVGT